MKNAQWEQFVQGEHFLVNQNWEEAKLTNKMSHLVCSAHLRVPLFQSFLCGLSHQSPLAIGHWYPLHWLWHESPTPALGYWHWHGTAMAVSKRSRSILWNKHLCPTLSKQVALPSVALDVALLCCWCGLNRNLFSVLWALLLSHRGARHADCRNSCSYHDLCPLDKVIVLIPPKSLIHWSLTSNWT